jgi:hypothetical protein
MHFSEGFMADFIIKGNKPILILGIAEKRVRWNADDIVTKANGTLMTRIERISADILLFIYFGSSVKPCVYQNKKNCNFVFKTRSYVRGINQIRSAEGSHRLL